MMFMPLEEVRVIVLIQYLHTPIHMFFLLYDPLLCVYCDIAILGSSEFFLNSIPDQLYGKCL